MTLQPLLDTGLPVNRAPVAGAQDSAFALPSAGSTRAPALT